MSFLNEKKLFNWNIEIKFRNEAFSFWRRGEGRGKAFSKPFIVGTFFNRMNINFNSSFECLWVNYRFRFFILFSKILTSASLTASKEKRLPQNKFLKTYFTIKSGNLWKHRLKPEIWILQKLSKIYTDGTVFLTTVFGQIFTNKKTSNKKIRFRKLLSKKSKQWPNF